MTRKECELILTGYLKAMNEVVKQYKPDYELVNIYISQTSVSAFGLNNDENGKSITGDYFLNAVELIADEEASA